MSLPVLRPRQPFLGLVLAAILGIAAADRWPAPLVPWIAGSLFLAAWMFWRPSVLGCIALTGATFFTLHTLRFHHDPARAIAEILAGQPRVIRATGIVAAEPQRPEFWDKNVTCFFPLEIEQSDLPVPSRGVRMNVTWASAVPRYGDRLTLTGSARNVAPKRNPGQFDFTRYLQRTGVWSEIEVRFAVDGTIVGHDAGSRVWQFAISARQWIQRQLAADLQDSPEIAALIQSMVLGLRGDTPDDARELFQRTGTLHLFAVSGLNVAMLAAMVLVLLRMIRVTGAPALLVALPLLAFYALVTGLTASCVRATIMGSLLLLAPVFDRRAVPMNSICAAGFVILAWDTNQLFSPGFQFSFVLVLAIGFLARRIERRILPLGMPDPFLPRSLWTRSQSGRHAVWALISSTLGVTFAAWIGSLAFTAGYFHLFSFAAIGANLVAVPIAFLVLALGVATLLTAGWWKAGALLFSNANWFAAKSLLAVVAAFARVPGGHVYVEVGSAWKAAPACALDILDLREGAATHLRAGSSDWLLDCGSAFTYDNTILPYLRTRGVNTLEGLLLTHGDSHHIGGALGVMADFRPRTVVDSALQDRSSTRDHFHLELARRRRGKSIVARDDLIHASPVVTMRVLFPPAGIRRSLADDKAIVMQITAAGRRILLMSDSGFSTERWLVENEADLRSDVLVKGQHARDLSGTTDFLARVQPLAIVCGSLDFSHAPTELDEWEAAATAQGAAVFRQDRTGAVHVEIAPDGALELRAFLGDQTFRSRAR